MPYANAITMIEDLPPMIQLPTKYHPSASLAQQNQYTNPYFEEVIKDHPTVQSKIRPTEVNPMAKYEATMAPSSNLYERITTPPPQPTQVPLPPQHPNYMLPDYPLSGQPPAFVQQDYLPSSMIPHAEERHLPIVPAQGIPVRYKSPMVPGSLDQNTYPIVENFLSCRDVMAHINSCPICSNIYHKNDRMYIGIIAILVLLIFIMVFRFSRK